MSVCRDIKLACLQQRRAPVAHGCPVSGTRVFVAFPGWHRLYLITSNACSYFGSWLILGNFGGWLRVSGLWIFPRFLKNSAKLSKKSPPCESFLGSPKPSQALVPLAAKESMLRPTAEQFDDAPASQPSGQAPDRGQVNVRTLFELEESRLLRYAFSLTGRREVAEEVVQEAFLQLHKRWSEVHSPLPWLFRCVRNLALDQGRQSKREAPMTDRTIDSGQALDGSAVNLSSIPSRPNATPGGDPSVPNTRVARSAVGRGQAMGGQAMGGLWQSGTEHETPDAECSRQETALVLRQTLAELSDIDQQLIELKYFEGLKYREISERTGLSVSNVGFRLHQVLKVLANRLPLLGVEE